SFSPFSQESIVSEVKSITNTYRMFRMFAVYDSINYFLKIACRLLADRTNLLFFKKFVQPLTNTSLAETRSNQLSKQSWLLYQEQKHLYTCLLFRKPVIN